jgi:DUF971 family protein
MPFGSSIAKNQQQHFFLFCSHHSQTVARIIFDDLHETGIYSWNYLYELGVNKYAVMRKYIKELKKRGKSRDPRANKVSLKSS